MSESPQPPGRMIKGFLHKKVEQLVNGNPDARLKFRAALEDQTRDYLQILMDYAVVTQAQADRLRRTWYSSSGWWQAYQPVEPVVRQSLIKALDLAIERNLPIDSYWQSDGDRVAVIVTCSDHQVTRLIVTPASPAPPANPTQPTTKVPIWIVKQDSGGESPGDEDPWQVVEHVAGQGGVITMQLKDVP
jgi:hypothetical protein